MYKILTVSLEGLRPISTANMSWGPFISDCICKTLVFFNVLVIQARLTSRLTPSFSKNLDTMLPGHKRVLFWWLNPSDSGLNAFLVLVSALLSVVLWVQSLRTIGLPIGCFLALVALYSDTQLGESFVPHSALLLMCCSAMYLGQ